MYCGGGHLGFPIGIKNRNFVEDLPMIIPDADRKSKMAATAGHRLTLDPMGKYSNAFFSETTIIPGQFGFNCPSGFREEAF
jgi:hypothetical protein